MFDPLVGLVLGLRLVLVVGEKDGFEVGSRLGNVVGDSEMCVEGSCDGLKDGCLDERTLGDTLG